MRENENRNSNTVNMVSNQKANNSDDYINQAFNTLKSETLPTEEQKERMLFNIQKTCEEQKVSFGGRIIQIICTYPWRFAFGVSAVQAVVFTLIFNTQYTNLFLGI